MVELLDLPEELLICILECIDSRGEGNKGESHTGGGLASIALVSHGMRRLTLPILYRTISLSKLGLWTLKPFRRADGLVVHPPRFTRVPREDSGFLCSPHITSLARHLRIFKADWRRAKPGLNQSVRPVLVPAVIDVIKSCFNLESIETLPPLCFADKDLVYAVYDHPVLQHVGIAISNSPYDGFFNSPFFKSHFAVYPSMHKFTCDLNMQGLELESVTPWLEAGMRLRSLHVDNNEDALHFLDSVHVSNLSQLRFSGCTSSEIPDILWSLLERNTNLVTIEVDGHSLVCLMIFEKQIPPPLPQSPDLQTLVWISRSVWNRVNAEGDPKFICMTLSIQQRRLGILTRAIPQIRTFMPSVRHLLLDWSGHRRTPSFLTTVSEAFFDFPMLEELTIKGYQFESVDEFCRRLPITLPKIHTVRATESQFEEYGPGQHKLVRFHRFGEEVCIDSIVDE